MAPLVAESGKVYDAGEPFAKSHLATLLLGRDADGQKVVLKQFGGDDEPDILDRVYWAEREALARAADTGHVVEVIDESGEARTHVLEFMPGKDLEHAANGGMDPLLALTLAAYVLGAVYTLQREVGLLHGDLKPSNVLLSESAKGDVQRGSPTRRIGRGWIKLADLEGAKVLRGTEPCPLYVRPGVAFGSPGYSPLEAGYRKPGTRGEMFSWAMLCWRILKGETPYSGGIATLHEGWNQQREWGRSGPPELGMNLWGVERVIGACLQADAAQRPVPGLAFLYIATTLAKRGVDLTPAFPEYLNAGGCGMRCMR